MTKDENDFLPPEEETPSVCPGNYSPVTVRVSETMGVLFLGILSLKLLIEWMRSEARYRDLLSRLEITHGNHSPEPR